MNRRERQAVIQALRAAAHVLRAAVDAADIHQNLVEVSDFIDEIRSAKDSDTKLRSLFEQREATVASLAEHGILRDRALWQWLLKNWPFMKDRQALRAVDGNVRDAANALKMALKDPDGFGQGIPLSRWAQNLLDWLEKFTVEINAFTQTMAPEHFVYRGLKVWNPDLLPDSVVKQLLDGINYVLELFKKRGVTALLDKTLNKVVLRHQTKDDETNVGWYHPTPQGGTITVTTSILDDKGSMRFLTNWVHEVFLHEIGHHVHLHLLDRDARQEWNAGWTPVKDAQKATKDAEKKLRSVTFPERQRFWTALVDAKGDLKKVKLKGIDKMKFHAWLAQPQLGRSLVTPKNLRWSKDGESTRDFLADPEGTVNWSKEFTPSEVEDAVASRYARIKNKLGVSDDDATVEWPVLSADEVKEYATLDKSVEQAIDALEVPSHYARTNEMEDFAETFVGYMDAPEKLSKQARFRMQRALWLSDFAGKPIKTVAKVVEA